MLRSISMESTELTRSIRVPEMLSRYIWGGGGGDGCSCWTIERTSPPLPLARTRGLDAKWMLKTCPLNLGFLSKQTYENI